MARVTLLLIPFLLMLPGCLSAAPQACQGEACDAPPTTPRFITRPPGVDFPPLPEEEALRSMRLADCRGLIATLDLPYDRVATAVPPAFEPWEFVPGTAVVGFWALECPRTVLADAILENYREVAVLAAVFPVNRSWEAGGFSFYVLDHLVSHGEAAKALNQWGFPAEKADFALTGHVAPILAGSSWDVRSPTLTLGFEFALQEPSQTVRNATNFYWTGTGPYARTIHHKTYTFDTMYQPGALRTSGSATTAGLMPLGAWSWIGSPLRTFSSSAVVDPELFGT